MIRYRAGYNYQLAETYSVEISIAVEKPIRTPYIRLSPTGKLTIAKGYAWDGPSGPAIDTKNFMRGSLIHDALYQLLRERHLGQQYRQAADEILRAACLEDGMTAVRAWWVFQGVRFGGGPAAAAGASNPILTAP